MSEDGWTVSACSGRWQETQEGQSEELTAPLASPLARELAAAVLVARAAVEAAAAAALAEADPAVQGNCFEA